MSIFKTQELPHDEAEAEGFARFNKGPHLTVDLPKGGSTITVRTPAGERVTFGFVSYGPDTAGGSPQLVDIQHHGPKRKYCGSTLLPVQNVRVFGLGDTKYSSDEVYEEALAADNDKFYEQPDFERPPTLTCVLFEQEKLDKRIEKL